MTNGKLHSNNSSNQSNSYEGYLDYAASMMRKYGQGYEYFKLIDDLAAQLKEKTDVLVSCAPSAHAEQVAYEAMQDAFKIGAMCGMYTYFEEVL